MLSLFRRRRKVPTNLFVSLDIGTELLKGILFEYSKVGVIALKHFYLRQPKKAMRSGKIINKELVLYGTQAILENLVVDSPLKGTKVMLGIAGDTINGVSIDVTYTRQNPNTPITPREESEILEFVYNKIVEDGKRQLAQRLGIPSSRILILHIGVVGMLVNGIPRTSMLGEKARSVKFHIYASFAPQDQIELIKEIMQRLGVEPAGIVVQPYAVARAFKGSRNVDFSAIFVDIGGGTTDVAIVKEGFSLSTRMYAFGGRVFTEQIAKHLNVSYQIAEDLKIKYTSGLLEPALMAKVREALAEQVRLWVESFKVALEEFKNVDEYPSQILLCGGGAMLPDLQDALRNFSWTSHLNFRKHPSVRLIRPQELDRVYIKDFELTKPYDVTPVSLARSYYDILENPKYNYVANVF